MLSSRITESIIHILGNILRRDGQEMYGLQTMGSHRSETISTLDDNDDIF